MIPTESPVTRTEKLKVAEAAVAALEKEHGKGSIMRMGSRVIVTVDCISTGNFSIDNIVIQAGGIPKSRITEIYGPEASGKTTLALQVVAEAQRQGGLAAYIDAEHSLDPTYAAALGVDTDNLFISQPDFGEQALEICESLIDTRAFDIIVIDSVAALVPKAELEGEMGDSHMGLQARLMSQAMRKLAGKIRKSNGVVIFINQIRDKIGVTFGSPETTTGGRALKFYASLRLDIRRIGQIKDGDAIVGNKTKVKAAKNKVGCPFREAEIDLIYGLGFDSYASLADYAIAKGVFVKEAGSWFSYEGERINGRKQVIQFLKDSPEISEKVKETLNKILEN